MLVSDPKGQTLDPKEIAWLIPDHAITVLPSVSSLTALRGTAKPSAAKKPMIGFGNPLLDGDQAHPQDGAYYIKAASLAKAHKGCAAKSELITAVLRGPGGGLAPLALERGIANVAHIKMQAPLPETADELCDVARDLETDVADMRAVWVSPRCLHSGRSG